MKSIALLIVSALTTFLFATQKDHFFLKAGYSQLYINGQVRPLIPVSFQFKSHNMYEGSMGWGIEFWAPYFDATFDTQNVHTGISTEFIYTVAQYSEGFSFNLSGNISYLNIHTLQSDYTYISLDNKVLYGVGLQINTPFLHYIEMGLSVKYTYYIEENFTSYQLVSFQIIFNGLN